MSMGLQAARHFSRLDAVATPRHVKMFICQYTMDWSACRDSRDRILFEYGNIFDLFLSKNATASGHTMKQPTMQANTARD